MSKIESTDSLMDCLVKLSEGNPGAVSVLVEIISDPEPKHSPKNFLLLLKLDTLECYGSRIWMLYKDVCKESLENLYKVIDLPKDKLNHAIDNHGEGITL